VRSQVISLVVSLVLVEVAPPLKECRDCFGSLLYWQSAITRYPIIQEQDPAVLIGLSYLARAIYLIGRQIIAFAIFDTWLFWAHYFAHQNRWWFSK
jgi:sterol desaturase/sphingolipid hydroxylase (fatty acid hydroxylase superfamily)